MQSFKSFINQPSGLQDDNLYEERYSWDNEFKEYEKYDALYRGQKVTVICRGHFVDDTLSGKKKCAIFEAPGYKKMIITPLSVAKRVTGESPFLGEFVDDDILKLKVAAIKGIFDEDFNFIGKATRKSIVD